MVRHFSCILRRTKSIKSKFKRDTSGSMVAMVAVLPVLIGVVALGVQTGQIYRDKRQMQSAADAAALVGSADSLAGNSATQIATDAVYEAQRNGYTNGSGGVTVIVNSPPTSGSNINSTGAVEVIVKKNLSYSLGAALSAWLGVANSSSFTMQTRSVAAQGSFTSTAASPVGCIVALTPNAEQGVIITDNYGYYSRRRGDDDGGWWSNNKNFTADCTIVSNGSATSSNSNASIYSAGYTNFTLNSVWTRGSFYAASGTTVSTTASVMQNQTGTVTDPYASLGTPSPGTCTQTSYSSTKSGTVALSPGTYCKGLSVTNATKIRFSAGTYFVADGDLVLSTSHGDDGAGTITCTNCTGTAGVTFVLTQTSGTNANIGGVSISSESTVTLTAPSTGTYAGILFYQDRRATVGTMTSTSKIFSLSSVTNATLSGAVYFPNNLLSISRVTNMGASNTGCAVWIGRYVNFDSVTGHYIAGCPPLNTTPATVNVESTRKRAKTCE